MCLRSKLYIVSTVTLEQWLLPSSCFITVRNICALTRTGSTSSEEKQRSEVQSVLLTLLFPTSIKKAFSTSINFPLTVASRLPLCMKRWEVEEKWCCNRSIGILKHRAGTRQEVLEVLEHVVNSVDPKTENSLVKIEVFFFAFTSSNWSVQSTVTRGDFWAKISFCGIFLMSRGRFPHPVDCESVMSGSDLLGPANLCINQFFHLRLLATPKRKVQHYISQ